MTYTPEHPSDWTLELVAEEALPADEQALVAAHLDGCTRCAAEVEAYRALFGSIQGLPEFSPSAAFTEAVMSRVRIAPQAAGAAWLVRWLPSTRRGWTLLLGLSLAPALPLIALTIWLLSHPLLTPGALWTMVQGWTRDSVWAMLVRLVGGVAESGLVENGRFLLERLFEVPIGVLVGAALVLAVGIPLSVWTLYRTLRAPTGGTLYAN